MTVSALALALAGPAAVAQQPVEIVAHRGVSFDAPENTVAAVKLAWEQKADAAEFDIHLTKDRKVVLMHDKDTRRTAGGVNKVIADSTRAELHGLDVGKWKGEKFAGERVPTLAETLAVVPDGKRVFIEVSPAWRSSRTCSKRSPPRDSPPRAHRSEDSTRPTGPSADPCRGRFGAGWKPAPHQPDIDRRTNHHGCVYRPASYAIYRLRKSCIET